MTGTAVTPLRPQVARQPGLHALTGLRGIAAVLIVLSHVSYMSGAKTGSWASPVLNRLDVGVAIFFVISGYLLYRPFARAHVQGRPRPRVGRYLGHRAARVLPAYWIAVVATGVLLAENRGATATEWLRQITLTQLYQPGGFFTGLIQTWSLNSTVVFYLVLPLLAVLVAVGTRIPGPRPAVRRQGVLIALMTVAGPLFLVAFATGHIENPLAHNWLPAYLGWFAAGMAIAVAEAARGTGCEGRFSRFCADLASVPGTSMTAAVVVFAIASTPVTGPRGLELGDAFAQVARIVLLAVVAFLVVVATTHRDADGLPSRHPVIRVLGTRPFRWLGDVSYGVFVYHLLVVELVYRVSDTPYFSGQMGAVLAATLAITFPLAHLSYHWIERPVARWTRRRLG